MFDNIKSLRLTFDTNDKPIAAAMISAEGEVMEFRDPGIDISFQIYYIVS